MAPKSTTRRSICSVLTTKEGDFGQLKNSVGLRRASRITSRGKLAHRNSVTGIGVGSIPMPRVNVRKPLANAKTHTAFLTPRECLEPVYLEPV